MPTTPIQVHYVVCVPLNIEIDADGNPIGVVAAGTPFIDPDVDLNYGEGDVFDPKADAWRFPTEAEYDAGTARIGVFANNGDSDTAPAGRYLPGEYAWQTKAALDLWNDLCVAVGDDDDLNAALGTLAVRLGIDEADEEVAR